MNVIFTTPSRFTATHRSADLRSVCANDPQRLTRQAGQWGHILRTELTVFADNARAIALYERFGFEHEGRHRGFALRNGQYSDVLSMARLHPNPPRWTGNMPS